MVLCSPSLAPGVGGSAPGLEAVWDGTRLLVFVGLEELLCRDSGRGSGLVSRLDSGFDSGLETTLGCGVASSIASGRVGGKVDAVAGARCRGSARFKFIAALIDSLCLSRSSAALSRASRSWSSEVCDDIALFLKEPPVISPVQCK